MQQKAALCMDNLLTSPPEWRGQGAAWAHSLIVLAHSFVIPIRLAAINFHRIRPKHLESREYRKLRRRRESLSCIPTGHRHIYTYPKRSVERVCECVMNVVTDGCILLATFSFMQFNVERFELAIAHIGHLGRRDRRRCSFTHDLVRSFILRFAINLN